MGLSPGVTPIAADTAPWQLASVARYVKELQDNDSGAGQACAGGITVGWLWLVMGWFWAGYGLVMGWLWARYGLVMGWLCFVKP